MSEAPSLSIVVPVYNGAATIGELVNALRALDIAGGLEIVLVVDGSPDNSLAVCKQLAAEPGATSSPWTTTCRTRQAR
jgi:glycosyltransferase involved in cell wall biosynthesis